MARSSARAPLAHSPISGLFNRSRNFQIGAECTVEARLETSTSTGERLLAALNQGMREFVLTSRDGKLSAGVRLAVADASITPHTVNGYKLQIDWSQATVARGRDRVTLSQTELRLLAALIEGSGHPISRTDLIRRVWPEDDEDMIEERENALAVYVCSLRKRLKSIGVGSALHTVRGVGYQIG